MGDVEIKESRRIPLCVSKDTAKIAQNAGAIWNADERAWYCTFDDLQSDRYYVLRPFVPRRFRTDLDGPVIRPWMVPQSLWGKNLRAVLAKSNWDFVRKSAYQKSGYRC